MTNDEYFAKLLPSLDRSIAILERYLAEREAILAELRPAVAPALELLAEDRRRRERLAPGDAV